jgi:enoyl-CoA hydratase/3-hydroxyacyl-CoA dehydrogenase
MANEVAKLVGEDVADPSAIDTAMKLGAGFPDGPARMADDAGLDTLADALSDLHDETGEPRYEPADLLVEYAEANRGFYETDEDSVTYEDISVERDGRIGRLTIDRAHRMNTLTVDMLEEIEAAIEEFEDDDSVRAVLVTGAGDRAFSTGADANEFRPDDSFGSIDLSRKGHRVFGRFESSSLPVVAAIDGYCLGGGMELATACDLRIASERSTFGQTEHNLGILPAWGGTQRLPRVVGEGRAKEIIFTADHYDAETMADYGFVNEVVPTGEFEERAEAFAREIAAGPPIAQELTKGAMLAGRDDIEAGLTVEAQAFGLAMATDDVMEGVSAFMEDREPEFEGK